MTPLLGIIFLFFLAYIGSFLYQRYNLATGWVKVFLFSGSLNLVIGYMIGPHFLGLLSDEIIGKLYVLVGLVLGWAGFLIGLQAKVSELKRFQSTYYLYSVFNFFLTFIGIISVIFFMDFILNLSLGLPVIILSGILGTVSSPILVGLLKEKLNLRGPLIHLLQFSVALDNMVGVIFFGLTMLFVNQFFYQDIHIFLMILGSFLFIIFMSWLFYKISIKIDNLHHFFLVLVGFLLVIVGVALNLNQSVLLISFLFGVVLTNLPVDTRKLYQSIDSAEKPLYYLMMIFIGAIVGKIVFEYLLIILILVILRIVIKYLAGNLARLPFQSTRIHGSRLGLPKIGMGGIALAMALDFHLSSQNEFSQFILFVVSAMAITNVVISTGVFRTFRSE
jgi:Kef-type K+ transport system membrane component KefB